MTIPDKLCPMCFCNSRASRANSPCLGSLCMWFDDATNKCVGPVKAEAESKPKTKKAAKE